MMTFELHVLKDLLIKIKIFIKIASQARPLDLVSCCGFLS